MVRLLLFYRLMVRPVLTEPVRTALTVLAIALGVAVVLAIDLASTAATGSFRSSMETLAGDSELEIIAAGGVPESVMGTLSALPYSLRFSVRIEDYAVAVDTKHSYPLLGLDLIAEGQGHEQVASSFRLELPEDALKYLGEYNSIWVGQSLQLPPGARISLQINDRVREYVVRGVYPDSDGNAAAIVMDIAAAQYALNRFGRVDRILAKVPQTIPLEEWRRRFQQALPEGVEVRPAGTGTDENRRMLAAFRWNLRLLSYIALVVGAFLIYNTISVSVVRRRAEIGIVRALGAGRNTILAAFLGEAAGFGFLGALLGWGCRWDA